MVEGLGRPLQMMMLCKWTAFAGRFRERFTAVPRRMQRDPLLAQVRGCQGLCGGLDMGCAPGARTEALQVTPSFERCPAGMSDQTANVIYINRSIDENENINFCGRR